MWVHWGATSQDILDTAAMLVAQRSGRLIDADLQRLADGCAGLARAHRHTLMVGRTRLQQALPVSFGLKAAGWLAGVDDARRQLDGARGGLAVQLGGAVGTLASLGADGPAVLAAFARRLGLAEPVLPWHSARQRVSALAGALGVVAGTAAKISTDVVLLSQTEVGEAEEPAPGGSSTLPHKRNPAASVAVIAAARRAHALLPVLFSALIAEHERAVGAWHAELGGAVRAVGPGRRGRAARTADVVAGLQVAPETMAANLARLGWGAAGRAGGAGGGGENGRPRKAASAAVGRAALAARVASEGSAARGTVASEGSAACVASQGSAAPCCVPRGERVRRRPDRRSAGGRAVRPSTDRRSCWTRPAIWAPPAHGSNERWRPTNGAAAHEGAAGGERGRREGRPQSRRRSRRKSRLQGRPIEPKKERVRCRDAHRQG